MRVPVHPSLTQGEGEATQGPLLSSPKAQTSSTENELRRGEASGLPLGFWKVGHPQSWGGTAPLWPSSRAVRTAQPGLEEAVFQPLSNGTEELGAGLFAVGSGSQRASQRHPVPSPWWQAALRLS